MSSDSNRSRQILGIVISAVLFVVWILVDMYIFPGIGGALGYPVFEIVAYGSWFVLLLIILAILSVTGAIPSRSKQQESISSAQQ
ncbi:MAG: hypothetical protein P1Q69_00145 [Candidatus Thorarchaeota archaeon]|nr:hypothetical protein [Candidatus Thorarchaeota archaeon]